MSLKNNAATCKPSQTPGRPAKLKAAAPVAAPMPTTGEAWIQPRQFVCVLINVYRFLRLILWRG